MIIHSTLDTYLNQCNCLMLWIMLQWRSLVCRLRMSIHISIGFVLPNYFLGSGDQVICSQNLCKLLSDWGHFQLDTLFVIFKSHREHGWILKTCLRYLMTALWVREVVVLFFLLFPVPSLKNSFLEAVFCNELLFQLPPMIKV